jgi:Domain of unknown function (DUF4270)
MLFLAACTPPNDAGKDILNPDDIVSVHYVDTFDLEMTTVRLDSVNTTELSRCLFGNYLDESMGWIFAETYLQPKPNGSNLKFGNKLTLDSIVLSLDLLGFYGRYNDPLPLEIFQLTGNLSDDSVYYSNDRIMADTSYDLARGYVLDFSAQPGFFDFVKIRLDDSLGRRLLFAPVDSLKSADVFTSFFKGLQIRTKPVASTNSREPGGIFSFDPRSSKTNLTLYYHDSTAVKNYAIPINDETVRFHRVERQDAQGRIIDLAVTQSGPNAPYGVVECGALSKVYLKTPSLTSINPAGINRAELYLPVDPAFFGSGDRYAPPPQLLMFLADSTGRAEYNIGVISSSADYDKTRKAYIIPITNTVQQILAGRLPNNGFLLVPSENGVSLNRAVLAGPGHPTLQPKLRVMYTTLPQ